MLRKKKEPRIESHTKRDSLWRLEKGKSSTSKTRKNDYKLKQFEEAEEFKKLHHINNMKGAIISFSPTYAWTASQT